MRRRRAVLAATLVILALPCGGAAQTMVTMTTASVSAEGEGGLYMVAGSDVLRSGVISRFLLSTNVDLGFQIAFDRYEDSSFLGGGIDFKFHLPIATSDVPIYFALDAGAGFLEGSDRRRIFLAPGFIVSGRVETSGRSVLEPYMGLYALFTRRTWKEDCDSEYGPGCQHWEKSFFGEGMLRLGTRIPISADIQVLLEMNVNGETTFGAGVNVLF